MEAVNLIGAEDVARAGHRIGQAADEMARAASSMDTSLELHARRVDETFDRLAGRLTEFLLRFDESLERSRRPSAGGYYGSGGGGAGMSSLDAMIPLPPGAGSSHAAAMMPPKAPPREPYANPEIEHAAKLVDGWAGFKPDSDPNRVGFELLDILRDCDTTDWRDVPGGVGDRSRPPTGDDYNKLFSALLDFVRREWDEIPF